MEIRPGFGPVPTPTRSLAALSAQRADVLDALASEDRDVTVDEVAQLLGLHANTVRSHLDGLIDANLVSRHSARSGRRGRPSWRYRVRPERLAGAPEYVGLAIALAEQVAELSDDPRGVALEAGRRWAEQLPQTHHAADVTALLDDLGFGPQREGADIRLTRCPLLQAAKSNPKVICGMHEGLIRAQLGEDDAGRLESFAGPGYCVWHGSDRD